MGKLTNKVAVVTGASKGIGAGIAKALAADGASVVVNYASSKEGADKVVAEIKATGGKAVAVQGDVSKQADISKLFAETKKAYGRLDVLVNNAGVYEFSPLGEVTEAQFHKMFDLNVLGLILSSQEALKYFGPEGGSIINIGSVASSQSPDDERVHRDQGCGGLGDSHSVEGTRTEEDPGELDQSGDGGDGRRAHGRLYRERLSEMGRVADSAGTDRAADGHCSGCCLPGFG